MKKITFIFFIFFLFNFIFASSVFAEDLGKIVIKNGKYYVVKYKKYILKNYDKIEKISNSKDDFYFVELNGKVGIMNANGSPLLKPIYDEIKNGSDNFFIIKTDGKYGLYNFFAEKWEIVPHLNNLTLTANNYYIARKNNKYGIFSTDDNTWHLDLSFDIISFEHNNFYIRKHGYDGILNQFLEVVIPMIYDEIEFDEEHNTYFVSKNNLWGIADLYGTFILKPIYQDIIEININSDFAGYITKLNSKYGVLNAKNKLIVPYIYDKIERFSEYDDLWLKVKKRNKYGILKYDGKKIVKCKYEKLQLLKNANLEPYENDIYAYRKKNKDYVFLYKTDENFFGVLNSDGKEIVFPNYQEIYSYFYNKNSLTFVVKRNNRYGVVEVDNNGVQTFKYINKPLDDIISDTKSKIIK